MSRDDVSTARPVPLWPLPLLAGLLPALGALLALILFNGPREAFCNPFVDDCISISRMARQGLANQLFRLLVLPGAVLQVLTWFAVARVLGTQGLARCEARALAALGAAAGSMLVVYAGFLGSDGEIYAWLRRWGTLTYFGGTYLAMLVFTRALQRLHGARRIDLPRRWQRVLEGLLAFVTAMALAHVAASLSANAGLEDRLENLTEWWGALSLTLAFAVMALLWRRWRWAATLEVGTLTRR